MNRFTRTFLFVAAALGQIGPACAAPDLAQEFRLDRTPIRGGAHPWYEVKVDPANPQNLIVCGTRLDPIVDAPIGFVYSSIDGGKTWKTALEDRSSLWVTEQSCAFGPDHRAYFISEASRVASGTPQHEQGTTRLYFSSDSGQNWTETLQTGWADYSTSAADSTSGRLYTFFNAIAGERGRTWGSNVGVLVFSSDGRSVEGPFFDRELQEHDYDGTFPSGAVSLKRDVVATLYYATKASTVRSEVDLGILRAQSSEIPRLTHTVILHRSLEQDCLRLNDASLAYDLRSDKLFVIYVEGCKDRQITLTSSDDEGRTWSKGIVVASFPEANNPSLMVAPDGSLDLLWQDGEGSARWLFSCVRNQKLMQPAMEVSPMIARTQPSNDSLQTWIYQSNERHDARASEASITVNVVNMLNIIWRSSGLVATAQGLVAVWPSGDDSGMQLYSGRLTRNSLGVPGPPSDVSDESDVTSDTVILYGGRQQFDPMTGKLDVCLKLGNRGSRDIRVPIKLEATELESPIGSISALNATNGRPGVGATWDISAALTGTQVPPLATSDSFCLSFRVSPPTNGTYSSRTGDLLVLKLRVIASKIRRPDPAPHGS